METFAKSLVTHARQCSSLGNSKAFDLYITAFEKCPSISSLYEAEFRVVLFRINEVLADSDRFHEIFNNFERAIKVFPNSMHLLNEIGKYLYKYGFYTEACSYFKNALKCDAGYVNAEKNLNCVKDLLIDRWHFRMLNDKIRNEAYLTALRESLIPFEDSVLDLGTGTGLLAMYARDCKPKSITACDSSDVMIELAKNISMENDVQDILIVHAACTEMHTTDIDGKKTLLVTEMFDSGLFGEHILENLNHSWKYFLYDRGRVIPGKAEFFVMGAKCDQLNLKYQLSSFAKENINISDMYVHTLLNDEETYDCEDVHLFKDIKYITEPQSAIKIDFNDIRDIQDKLNCTEPYNVTLRAITNGEINVIVGWFNLYLTDSVTITTDPNSDKRANAWQQAIFFDFIPRHVKENECIDLKLSIANGSRLTLLPEPNSHIFHVSEGVVRFLNDFEYTYMIKQCIGMACVYLGQIAEISDIDLADFSPFPLFGLIMLKRGARSLVCYAKTENDKRFLVKVFEANAIQLSTVRILTENEWNKESLGKEKYHVIFCNFFDIRGEYDIQQHEIAKQLSHGNLVHGGLLLPANVRLVTQLVYSKRLDIDNRINDINVGMYKMAEIFNQCQVTQNICVNFTQLNYTEMSEPLVLGSLRKGLTPDVFSTRITKDGNVNAILCWYSIELMDGMQEISTKRPNCFMQGMVYLTSFPMIVFEGDNADILCCVDPDGDFKLLLDVDEEA